MEFEEEIDCDEEKGPLDHLKEFIVTLEQTPELWDMKHPSYTNRYIRHQKSALLLPILKKIKPHARIEDVKKKIRVLQAVYRRELRKMAANDKYVSKSWHTPLLHFFGEARIDKKIALQIPIEYNSLSEAPTTKKLTKIPSTKKIQSKLYSRSGQSSKSITKTNHKNSQSPKSITQPLIPNTTLNHHLAHPIALEWASTLERLDPIQRIFAKKAINDVLFEAELGNLSRDSVSINLNNSQESGIVFTSSQYSHASGNISGQDSSNNSTLPSPLGSPKSED